MADADHIQAALNRSLDPEVSRRFWAKVKKSDGCWTWTGSTDGRGYGGVRIANVLLKAHRVAFFIENGYAPPEVDHRCHTTLCVRASHLRAVTRAQNQENRSGPTVLSRSRVRGVCWAGHAKMWRVYANHAGRRVYSGYFHDLADAERAAVALRCSLQTHNDVDRKAAA